MKNVILLAPPAAGKGTIANDLKNLGYIQISIGDTLRRLAKEDKALGEAMQTGGLVDDKIIFKALNNKLDEIGNKPYILDGFPRNIEQAKMYNELLEKEKKDLGVVIYLDVDKEVLLKRATSRVVCLNCGRSYSLIKDELKPNEEGICDDCNTNLIKRKDDTEEVFESRYNTFIEKTFPLIKYYEEQNNLYRITELEESKILEEVKRIIGF